MLAATMPMTNSRLQSSVFRHVWGRQTYHSQQWPEAHCAWLRQMAPPGMTEALVHTFCSHIVSGSVFWHAASV